MAAIPNEILLGKDCTLTIDGAELKGIVDVTITCEAETIDTSTRDDGGFSAKLPGMKSVSISLNLKRYKSELRHFTGRSELRGRKNADCISVVTNKSLSLLRERLLLRRPRKVRKTRLQLSPLLRELRRSYGYFATTK